MAWSRRLEVISGVAAGALGFLALGVALFAPLGTMSGCMTSLSPDGVTRTDCSTTHVSIAQIQGLVSLLPAIILIAAPPIGIAVFAVFAVRHSVGRGSLVPLWISVAVLYMAMFLAILSIGIFFAPSALLALLAAVSGSLPDRRGTLSSG
jgi:hypothetical protein